MSQKVVMDTFKLKLDDNVTKVTFHIKRPDDTAIKIVLNIVFAI